MNSSLSKQFLSHCKRFIESQEEGELINLYEVYEDYGQPKFRSPRKLLRTRPLRNLAKYLIEKNDYKVEKVIKYSGKDIYVCYDLAMSYLMNLDITNYLILNDYLRESGPLDKFLGELRER
jgi:hypothetical protein